MRTLDIVFFATFAKMYVMLDRLYGRKEEQDMLEGLYSIAEKHQHSHEKLVLLDFDPERYPGQSLQSRYNTIKAAKDGPLSPEVAATIANDIDPRYPLLEQRVREETSTVDRLVELIKDNNNILNGTDHAELVDIALWNLALTGYIKQKGVELRSGLVVSKMVDFLGIDLNAPEPTPIRDLLGLGFDRTFLVIPPNSELFDRSTVKDYNERSTRETAGTFRRKARSNAKYGPMVLGVALPGSVNKPLASDPEKTVVGRVNDGITAYAGVENTMATASAVRLEGDTRVFIDDVPMRVETHNDVEALVGKLITGLTGFGDGEYLYDKDGDLETIDPAKAKQQAAEQEIS